MATELKFTKDSVVVYLLEFVDDHTTHVHKLVNDEKELDYIIERGECSCKSYHYTGECKHVHMKEGKPPSLPMDTKKAREVARRLIKQVKTTMANTKIIGDIVERADPVTSIHITGEANDETQHSFRIVGWENGTAIMIDKIVK